MITGQAQRTDYRSGIASIVVSVFVDILVEFDQQISDGKGQITTPILSEEKPFLI